MVTLNDISRKTGLSVATVSHTLNGRAGYSAKTRQRVRETADALGYSANPLARGLLGKSTKTIGIIWSLGRPHAGATIQEFGIRLWGRGYTTVMANSLSDPIIARQILSDFARRGVDGVIFQASQNLLKDEQVARKLKGFRAAVAVTDQVEASPVDLVVQDVGLGVERLMDYWLGRGRRRIGFLGNPHSNSDKFEPLMKKLREAGLSDGSVAIDPGAHGQPMVNNFDLYWACLERQFLHAEKAFPYDAVLCAADGGAGALLKWLTGRGLRVPEDVAVAGVEDVDMTRATTPPLASINRHSELLSNLIEELLFRRLESDSGPIQLKTIPSTFVWRESAGLEPDHPPSTGEAS